MLGSAAPYFQAACAAVNIIARLHVLVNNFQAACAAVNAWKEKNPDKVNFQAACAAVNTHGSHTK